jgi:hypothetical protein
VAVADVVGDVVVALMVAVITDVDAVEVVKDVVALEICASHLKVVINVNG